MLEIVVWKQILNAFTKESHTDDLKYKLITTVD